MLFYSESTATPAKKTLRKVTLNAYVFNYVSYALVKITNGTF